MTCFDLRTYHVADGAIGTLERVLREVLLPIMPDHGMRAIGFWRVPDGAMLYQVTEHRSLAAVAGNWDRLHADPRWQAGLTAIRQDRSAVRQVVTTLLTGIDGLPPEAIPTGAER